MPSVPNIVLVTADHLRHDTLGHAGDPVIQTPAIDRLASEGVRFTNYFVQNPVCQPSRASIMTGRYPRHHGVRWNGNRLDENEMTMVEFFKEHGYTTAVIGKHHVAQERFRKSIDHAEANHLRNMDADNPFIQFCQSRDVEYKTGFALPDFRERLGAVPQPDQPEDCHLDSYVGDRALDWLKQGNTHQPFFLWLGFYGPHHPYVPSGRFATMYDPDDVPPFHRAEDDLARKPREYRLYCKTEDHKYRGFPDASDETFRAMKAAYYGMVSQLDWKLGQVLDALDETGLRGNTIVVFTSDHGEFLGDHGITAKAPFLLDCMLHVPLIVRGPNSQPGTADGRLTESVDLLPTLAHLAGLDAPEWVQGREFASAICRTDRGDEPERDYVYAEAVDKKCIRSQNWKYIHYPSRDYGELYDVRDDPHELSNLWDELPDRRATMREAYYHHLEATEDFHHPRYQRFTGLDPLTGEPITHYHTW